MQHHLQHDEIERGIGQRQPIHVRQPHRAMRRTSGAAARRERASASIALEASTPEPLADPRGQQLQHPPGAGADIQQPAGVRPAPVRSSAASTAGAGRSSARISSQSAPWRRKLSEATRARSASTRAAWRRSASSIGSSVGSRASRSRTSAPSAPPGRANQTLAPSGTPLQQAGVAQQLQVARQPRLRLAEDFGELHDAEFAARGQREQAQAGRFGGGTQGGRR